MRIQKSNQWSECQFYPEFLWDSQTILTWLKLFSTYYYFI